MGHTSKLMRLVPTNQTFLCSFPQNNKMKDYISRCLSDLNLSFYECLGLQMFADHDTSVNPIDVPRNSIWNLRRRTVYFGTSVSSIFRGKQNSLPLTYGHIINISISLSELFYLRKFGTFFLPLCRVDNRRNSVLLLERYGKPP